MRWASHIKYALLFAATLLIVVMATHRIDVNSNQVRVNPLDVKMVETQE